ncbi:hypothetical protein PJ267_05100 [Arthrobacter sp. OVS8]|nr:hypothetical protein PJ267_05100 [Arthrobacter sp. OVS8]
MGIGDNVRGAAEHALKDLAGLSERTDDGHVPEPGDPDETTRGHSSISEGSSAEAAERGSAGRTDDPVSENGPESPGVDNDTDHHAPAPSRDEATADEGFVPGPPQGVPGFGGLPEPDRPEGLRADPSEADEDPTVSMGRG